MLCCSASRSVPVLIGGFGFGREKYLCFSARYMLLAMNNVIS